MMSLTPRAMRCLLPLALMLTTGTLHAATIVGQVFRDGRPAAGLPISLNCAGAPPASGSTDERGGYRLSINASGRCSLQAGGATAEVVVFNQAPMQYDFELRVRDGQATLLKR